MKTGARNRIRTIFGKEVSDNLRDRRSLGSALLSALIGPVLILLLIVVLGKTLFRDITEKPLEVPLKGAENAPALVAYLEQNDVQLQPAPEDAETAVRNGDVALVVIIPPTYGEDFGQAQPATVQVVLDTSRQSAIPEMQRLRNLLESYSHQIGSFRLLARGISPSVTEAIAVEQVDVATPQSQVLIFLNMLPYLLIFTIFSGGAAVIIDATAGERERGSLEPLLINPAARWEFVVAKLLASLPFALSSLLVALGAFGIMFNVVPMEDIIGMRMMVDVSVLVGIFFVCIPMLVLASAIQMIIATFARSFKEAQTTVSFLPLVPALPGLVLAFMPVKPALWTMLIPTFGQQILINQFMRGEPVSNSNLAISALVTLAVAGALVAVAIRLYAQEKVVFGR